MKLLTNLQATAVQSDWVETRGQVHAVHDEPKPGFIRQVKLCGSGIIIQSPQGAVVIPLADLFALAEAHDLMIAHPSKRLAPALVRQPIMAADVLAAPIAPAPRETAATTSPAVQ